MVAKDFFYLAHRAIKNILEMKSKILTFRDRFDIIIEIRLGGVAKRLIWEMSVL